MPKCGSCFKYCRQLQNQTFFTKTNYFHTKKCIQKSKWKIDVMFRKLIHFNWKSNDKWLFQKILSHKILFSNDLLKPFSFFFKIQMEAKTLKNLEKFFYFFILIFFIDYSNIFIHKLISLHVFYREKSL